jgi:hypothetical protein
MSMLFSPSPVLASFYNTLLNMHTILQTIYNPLDLQCLFMVFQIPPFVFLIKLVQFQDSNFPLEIFKSFNVIRRFVTVLQGAYLIFTFEHSRCVINNHKYNDI